VEMLEYQHRISNHPVPPASAYHPVPPRLHIMIDGSTWRLLNNLRECGVRFGVLSNFG
jgi:hypothetical protein